MDLVETFDARMHYKKKRAKKRETFFRNYAPYHVPSLFALGLYLFKWALVIYKTYPFITFPGNII